MWCQCRILSIKWNDFISNITVAATSGLHSIINIVRAHWLGLFSHFTRFSCDVPASNIFTTCCTSGDGHPSYPSWRHSQVDNLKPPGLITSLLTLACLWPIHFLWHKIVRSEWQSLLMQRLYVSDWLTSISVVCWLWL